MLEHKCPGRTHLFQDLCPFLLKWKNGRHIKQNDEREDKKDMKDITEIKRDKNKIKNKNAESIKT